VSRPELTGVAVFTDHPEDALTLLIHVRGEPLEGGPPNHDQVALAVDAVDEACRGLRAEAVEIEFEPRDFPWARSAYVRDLDRRLVELAQR
jgi:catechol 2,3-dioxygenase-like lactoylglutathione lyase family enzyme